jgi:hypothetical protein
VFLMAVTSDGREEPASHDEPTSCIAPEQVEEGVRQGPDAQSPNAAEYQPMRSATHVTTLLRALALTEKIFAAPARDGARLGARRSEPDQPMLVCRTVMMRHPEVVRRAPRNAGREPTDRRARGSDGLAMISRYV